MKKFTVLEKDFSTFGGEIGTQTIANLLLRSFHDHGDCVSSHTHQSSEFANL